jgi:hypothetical protein
MNYLKAMIFATLLTVLLNIVIVPFLRGFVREIKKGANKCKQLL